jgi:hypothetical protein
MVANMPYTLDDPQNSLPQAGQPIEGNTHTAFAILSFAISISTELIQLIYGEQMFRRSTGVLQKLRFVLICLSALGMFFYVLGDMILGTSGSNWFGVSALGETLGGIFIALDFVAISYTPISANANAFVYGSGSV